MEKKVTDVVAALIWDGGKFLICRRPVHRARGLLREFMGGKVEPGEKKEQPALISKLSEPLESTGKVSYPCSNKKQSCLSYILSPVLFPQQIAPQILGRHIQRECTPGDGKTPTETNQIAICRLSDTMALKGGRA